MIKDYYKQLVRRDIIRIKDDDGEYITLEYDQMFNGYLTVLSGNKLLIARQLGTNAVAQLFTDYELSITDKILDLSNNIVYEVVYKYDNFHKYYDLKLSENIKPNETPYLITSDKFLFTDVNQIAFTTNNN